MGMILLSIIQAGNIKSEMINFCNDKNMNFFNEGSNKYCEQNDKIYLLIRNEVYNPFQQSGFGIRMVKEVVTLD